MTQIKAERYA